VTAIVKSLLPAVIVGVLLGGAACRAEKDAARTETLVNAEIARISTAIAGFERAQLHPELKDLPKILRDQLGRVQSSRTPELRLYRLRHPYTGTEILSFITQNKAAAEDLAQFEALWNRHRASFATRPEVKGRSLLHRALAEAAQNRAEKYFKASLPYAKASGAFSGIYYLAEAEANLRYRAFVESLPDQSPSEKAPRREELEAALRSLDQETLGFFEKDPVGRSAIQTSALTKEAHEQLEQNLLDAATLTILEARMELSRRQTAPGPAKLGVSNKEKQSIPAVFEASANERQDEVGRVIRADVLPLYTRLYQQTTASRVAPASVTVTLVRWPYT
jgi:hypothetical protein